MKRGELILTIVLVCWCVVGIVKRLQAQTAHSVTLTWATYVQGTDVATGFNVLRGTVSGGPYTKINLTVIPITTLTFTDVVVTPGAKYFYVLNAQDAVGDVGPNSTEVPATIPANPLAPAGLKATVK